MKISIIIPVFRGEILLQKLVDRITETCNNNVEYEILFICDGCNEKTRGIINDLTKSDNCIKTIYLNKNYGQHFALMAGFAKASGEFIITMDEDLQHAPEDIQKLIEKQKEDNYDLVYGRFTELNHSLIRNVFSNLFRRILKILIPDMYEDYSPYRLIRREIASSAINITRPFPLIDEFLCKSTKKIASVNIAHHPRPEGRSSYSLLKIVKLGILLTFIYSRFLSWLIKIGLAILILFFGLILFRTGSSIKSLIDTITGFKLILAIDLCIWLVAAYGFQIIHKSKTKNRKFFQYLNAIRRNEKNNL